MIRQEYLERIKFCEGLSRVPTRCSAGYLSIGYGKNIETNKLTPAEKAFINHPIDAAHPISEKEAEFLLKNDVEKIAKKLDDKYPWWRNLDSERQYVMLDMCYNMGIGALSKFTKTLNYMKEGNFDAAAEEIKKSKYYRQTGNRGARTYACLKTGVYMPTVTQRSVGGAVAAYLSGNGKFRSGVKEMVIEDKNNYNNCRSQIGSRADGKKSLKSNVGTKTAMKDSAARCKAKLKSMITAMNIKNKNGKAVDSEKAAKILYEKFGNKASGILKKALMSPVEYGKNVGDASIQTSRAAVLHLLKTEKSKTR